MAMTGTVRVQGLLGLNRDTVDGGLVRDEYGFVRVGNDTSFFINRDLHCMVCFVAWGTRLVQCQASF